MSKRYYVCDIIGDGIEEPFRPKVDDFGVNWVGQIKSDANGLPEIPWAIVLVATNNHAQLQNVPGITPLPDFPLDGKVSAMHVPTKNSMVAALQARGIDTSFVGSADGYRDTIRGLGLLLSSNFDENKFDISE